MSFKIAAIEIFVVPIRFRMRFKHALADRAENETIFVKLTSTAGGEGWGETLTRSYLTGENPETVVASMKSWWPDLKVLSFSTDLPTEVLMPFWKSADAGGENAAWAAIDLAIYDLWRRGTKSILTSPTKKKYPVSFPVTLDKKADYFLRIGHLLGFKHLKFKTSRDTTQLLPRLKSYRPHFEKIIVDGNGCFQPDDYRHVLELAKYGQIDYFEQPFGIGDIESASKLVQTGCVKVTADESLCCLRDAMTLIEREAANVFNIRLAKNGGITGALALAKLARSHSIGIQLGSLVGETGLLCNAGRYCLAALNPELYEYSFPGLLLKNNPVISDVPLLARSMGTVQHRAGDFAKVFSDLLRRKAKVNIQLD
jgi:L-alanine-DL-glutamate epimerase-like enolase superfamily enzyme